MTSDRRKSLQYLADMAPDLLDTSASEFERAATAAAQRQGEGQRFRDSIQWDGLGRDLY